MECYEGVTMIKSYRGLIIDGGSDTIVLHTSNGLTGYRVIKFELFPYKPAWGEFESLVQIFKVLPTTIATTEALTDFSNNELLAAALFTNTAATAAASTVTIFDNDIVNQDIYVTHTQQSGNEPINYYIELEQFKLDMNEGTVATLKDIRNTKTQV